VLIGGVVPYCLVGLQHDQREFATASLRSLRDGMHSRQQSNDRTAIKETHAAMTTKNAVCVTGAPVEMKADGHVKS
jgi:hypothetical protein